MKRNRIKRAVTVIEYEDDDGTHACLIVQDSGSCSLLYEEDYRWSMEGGEMHQVFYEGPPRSRQISTHLEGRGEITFFKNADDLFARWNGPQPGRPAGAIEPHREELEP